MHLANMKNGGPMQQMQNLSDTELIKNLTAGCDEAFAALFHRYKRDVRNVIVHFVNDHWTAEDLSQDAFLKIYASLRQGKYNEQGAFLPWALRIVRNLCMDHLRKAAQFRMAGLPPGDDSLCTDNRYDAGHQLSLKQRDAQLKILINCLPEEQRQVVCYRYFEELSFKEIAVLMNTGVNTSLGRMRYGLMHLRRQIDITPSCLWR